MTHIIINMVHNLDWLIYGLILFGNYRIGKGNLDGWLIAFYGSLLAILWGTSIQKYGVAFWNVLFCIIYIYSYFQMKQLLKTIATQKNEDNDEKSISK